MILLICSGFLTGCASTRPASLPREDGIIEALSRVGSVTESAGESSATPFVVVMRDRHPVTRGFQRVRPQLEVIQRANRLAVDYLVKRGFSLLGCERSLGRVELNATTRGQYERIATRLSPVDYLDGFSVYQPIRFELLHRGHLTVFGVEDPDLYEADVAALRRWQDAEARMTRRNLPAEERSKLSKASLEARIALLRHIDARGRAAAENLLQIARDQNHRQMILLLGGSHVPAAVGVLKKNNIAYVVFEPEQYEGRGPERAPEEFPE